MSYIIPSVSPFVSIKLTSLGRQKLALGQLNFSYFAIGDSEINYDREEIKENYDWMQRLSGSTMVMRPFDEQPNLKTYIKSNTATSPFQSIPSSNSSINVVKLKVNNEAKERGVFEHSGTTFTTNLSNIITPIFGYIPNTNINGSNTLSGLSGVTSGNTGDYILFKFNNSITGTLPLNDTTTPVPNLWYKIETFSGGTVTLDRNLPNYSGETGDSGFIIYKYGDVWDTIGSDTSTAYWDSGTLSFNSSINVTCYDVPVWNINNVWTENPAGLWQMSGGTYEDYTYFGSNRYTGAKNPYYGYNTETSATGVTVVNCNLNGTSYSDDISKSISIIHYTNNTISNLYGEFLFVDATNNKIVKVHLPNLMYHKSIYQTSSGTTMGMTFIASGDTYYLPDSNIEYIVLTEDPTLIPSGNTPSIVGKVFPQLKTIVFDDDEIVGAMSYKANRNWTLPELSAILQAPSGGTSTGVLPSSYTMYLTYSLENGDLNHGLKSSMPCQKYAKITNTTASPKDVVFKIGEIDQLPFMRKVENSGYDGLGFYASRFKLLYQIVASPNDRPDSSAWKEIDYTSNSITIGSSETIDPQLLENPSWLQTGFILTSILDSSSTPFYLIPLLALPSVTESNRLQFGDERIFYGNIETFIGATIYKTVFNISLNASQYNQTSNPTFDVINDDIKVSEIGVYDNNQNLVIIGKLAQPVELSAGSTVLLELAVDF